MRTIINFIKENIWMVIAGLVVYASFLFFTYSGNRMCDCETTDSYQPAHNRTSVNRFYHK